MCDVCCVIVIDQQLQPRTAQPLPLPALPPRLLPAGGGKDLEEPLVVRPTSETIVNHMFSQVGWVCSSQRNSASAA